MKILFLSNGHGEDLIAARLIKEMPQQEIAALPIVGAGLPYEELGIRILGPRKSLPSGGFIYQSFSNMIRDIASGLGKNTLDQIRVLRQQKAEFDLAVCVGDIVPVIGALFSGLSFTFMGSAKSDHYDYSYTPWEKFILKRYCLMSYLRDQKTADNFAKAGIRSAYLGNPMMDCFEVTGEDFGLDKETRIVGILPGSRQDAKLNLEDILAAAKELDKLAERQNIKIAYLVSVAPTLDMTELKTALSRLVPSAVEGVEGPGLKLICTPKFGDILNRSDIIIGLAGTASEQAAGMGKPIVAFAGRGVQYTASFAKRQTQLLGEALSVVKRDPSAVAGEVLSILTDTKRHQRMSEVGRSRVSGRGSSKRIAESILSLAGARPK
ncbi:MAG: lipid-A-disaccharide synthase-related protein [Candidatus Margulisiibacteriota bacterium]